MEKLRKYGFLLLYIAGIFFGQALFGREACAQVSDPENNLLYSVNISGDFCTIEMNSTAIPAFIEEGYADYWDKRRSEFWALHIDVNVTEENQVIPAEFIQYGKKIWGHLRIHVRLDGEDYEWWFHQDPSVIVTKDFSPYASFSIPEDTGDYAENVSCIRVDSDFSTVDFGEHFVPYLRRVRIGGKITDVSEIFRNFYNAYRLESIREWESYQNRYYYSYMNNIEVPASEIGWIYFSGYTKDGRLNYVGKSCDWELYDDGIYQNGLVRLNDIRCPENGYFIVSDEKPLAAKEEAVMWSCYCKNAEEARLYGNVLLDLSNAIPFGGKRKPAAEPSAEPVTEPDETPAPDTTSVPGATSAPEDSSGTTGKISRVSGTYKEKKGVVLSWTSNFSVRAGNFVLYRKEKGKTYQKISVFSLKKKKYIDRSVKRGKSYRYKIEYPDKNGTYRKSQRAVSGYIKIPYAPAPEISLKKVRKNGQNFLSINVKQNKGKYVQIYLSQNGKTYKRVALKNAQIRKHKGKFLLLYRKNMGTIWCKVRTYSVKKKYSSFSRVKKIKLGG